MKRQSYLQQVAPLGLAPRRDALTVLTPPRLVVRPAPRTIEAFELETTLVTARAAAPRARAMAPKEPAAANIAATPAEPAPLPSVTHDLTSPHGAAAARRPSLPSALQPPQQADGSGARLPSSPAGPVPRASTPNDSEAIRDSIGVSRAARAAAAPDATRDEASTNEAAPREIGPGSNPPSRVRPPYQGTPLTGDRLGQPDNSRPPPQDRPQAQGDASFAGRQSTPAQTAADQAARLALASAAPRSAAPPREPSRTSLHIGTLEVRVTPSGPAAVAAAPRPPAPRQAARSGGAGDTRRIARGFGVFGLGQS